ncbi:hypothetical protein [Streptomyces olivaceoviridis]|uniref:hypothetical protein n=1 Tax=Streptomyces olivaceoviridis TaxID=1921 RepID=UPI0036769C85
MADLVERLVPDELWTGRGGGIPHRIARKGTVSWLAGCRRLHRRYERKAEHSLAFVGLAALLIGYRGLARTIRA